MACTFTTRARCGPPQRPARPARRLLRVVLVASVALQLAVPLSARAQEQESATAGDPLFGEAAEARSDADRRALEADPLEDAAPAREAPPANPVREAMEAAGAPAPASEPSRDPAAAPVPPAVRSTDSAAPPPSPEDTQREIQSSLEAARESREDVETRAAESDRVIPLPEPCTGPWDWVQYSSGEWLRGEFKRMRKKSFEFQSTRFDRRTSDWKHVRAFCFPNKTRFILYDHTVMSGVGRLEDGVLTVSSGDVTQEALRRDIWAILPGLPTEVNRWRSTVSAGLDTYTGNTEQSSLTASATIDREDPNTHLALAYDGSFSAADGQTTAARHRASAGLNVYFTRHLYASLPFVDYTSDRFQNLQHRVIPGLALGYEIFDLDDFEWSLSGGLAYQYTQYVSLSSTNDLRENDWGPRLATELEWDVVTDLTFEVRHYTVLLMRDFAQSNFHTRASLTYDVTDLIYLELGFWHERIREPREDQGGVTPKQDDLRYVFSLGLSFD